MTWDYLAVWRAAGVPAAEILKCMTRNDAELLGSQAARSNCAGLGCGHRRRARKSVG